MSRHDDTIRLRHMLDHAQEAIQLAAGRARDDLGFLKSGPLGRPT